MVTGDMPGLKVGHWLVNTVNCIPNPVVEEAGPVEAGYGFMFYLFQAIFFRLCVLAGATPENFGADGYG